MLRSLPSVVVGSLSFILIIFNTLILGILFHGVALVKFIAPNAFWQKTTVRLLLGMISGWTDINSAIYRLTQKTRWEVRGLEDVSRDNHYLIICNHQSWVDILVLLKVLNRQAPFPRFFLKQELIWVPVVGTACRALDFPFMKRYSKDVLAKRPELRGKDLETTRQAVEKFKDTPVSILNFLEGTRFTPAKHARQQSPYRHLLRPKAGGVAYVVSAMGEQFDGLLDITIIYPAGAPTFWKFLAGQTPRIVVHVKRRSIPPHLLEGDYLDDPDFRHQFQAWVSELWHKKDALIEQVLRQPMSASNPNNY